MLRKLLGLDIPSAATLLIGLVSTVWAAHAVYSDNAAWVYEENGFLETFQACLLAVACLIYLSSAFVEQRSDKLIILFCALLCYCFCLRELDVENFDVPQAIIFMGSGIGRNVSITLGFVAILGYGAISNFTHYLNAAVAYARSKTGLLLIVAGFFLLLGQFFEKHDQIPYYEFYEELSEQFGYFLIVLSAITTNSFLKGIRFRGQPSKG